MTSNSRYKTFGQHRSLRLPYLDYSQAQVYHLIWGTYKRRPFLSDPSLVEQLIDVLSKESKTLNIIVYAYCFMPDHVHFLVFPQSRQQGVIRFVQRYKGKTTHIYWKQGNIGKLWQRGFYDHVLRKDEDIREIVRYIFNNPVRKGLVDSYLSYPFSGSFFFPKEEL